MNSHERRYGSLALMILLLVAAFFLIKPFLIPLITAVIVGYVFYPLYKLLFRGVKKKTLAAFLCIILIILILAVPSFFIVNKVSSEAYLLFISSKQKISTGSLFQETCTNENSVSCRVDTAFKEITQDPRNQFYIRDFLEKSQAFVVEKISSMVLSVPKMILNLFVMFFTVFYVLVHGDKFMLKIKKVMPFNPNHQQMFIKRFSDVTYATIYGTLIIALMQGGLGALGFLMFGVKSPIIWGLVMAFFALIPFVGPGIIYIPASVFLVLDGLSKGSGGLITKGILLLLWGILIVSTVDNFLRPKIVGHRAHLHPVLVLLGVLGGLAMMGFIGIIIGPLILAFLLTFVDIKASNS